jgi:hypothetical protein
VSKGITVEVDAKMLVCGPDDELVRLVPSRPPMETYFTAHFLKGDVPDRFRGLSPTNPEVYIGIPWGTKDEIIALLRAKWAK